MIVQLRGKLISKSGINIALDVNGVGYGLQAPMSTVLQLPEQGADVLLHTYLVIREDTHALYGFLDLNEKMLFTEIIKVSGVGPKLALTLLSHLSCQEIIDCILLKDIKALVGIPGIGGRTANRLVVELHGKMDDQKFAKQINQALQKESNKNLADANAALIALGYTAKEANKALAAFSNQQATSEELIKSALKSLMKVCT